MKIIQTKILLLLLSINIICIESTSETFSSSNKEAVEFHLEETVIFDPFDNNYFKLDYDGNANITVFLFSKIRTYSFDLTDPKGNIKTIESEYVYNERSLRFNLDQKGIYFLNLNQGVV